MKGVVFMEINGRLCRKIYKNENYNVFSLISRDYDELKNQRGEIVVSSESPCEWVEGVPLRVEGEVFQSTYGLTVKASVVEISTESRQDSIKLILALKIKGIAEKKAEKIVDFTGDDVSAYFRMNDNACLEVCENVKGVTMSAVEQIQKALLTSEMVKVYYDMFKSYGATFLNCYKLKEIAPDIATFKELIEANPYRILKDAGLNFTQSDLICLSRGIDAHHPSRVMHIIKMAINEALTEGSTIFTFEEINEKIKNICNLSAYSEVLTFEEIIDSLQKSAGIHLFEHKGKMLIQYKAYRNLEESIVFYLRKLRKAPVNISPELIETVEKSSLITYSDNQKEAFKCLQGVSVITGGPGTGKSTVVDGIIKAYERVNPQGKIVLCAPTGRAAQQLSSKTGREAQTIHKLLRIRPFSELSEAMGINELSADLIIVDEVSMVDEVLFCSLLKSIKRTAHVVLVGDVDQLPSVSAGNVLSDLINCGVVPTFRLNTIFRQAEQSSIIYNSQIINDGKADLKESEDFEIIKKSSSDELLEEIRNISDRENSMTDAYKFQILSPTKKGNLGIDSINNLIQEMTITERKTKINTGDKVIFTKNNYENGYLNGDVGFVKSKSKTDMTVTVNGEDITITKELFEDVSLAYGITIHKSQGSEYETVLVVLPNYVPKMLQKKLIYTAVTRAKKKVYLLIQDEALDIAVSDVNAKSRKTGLIDIIDEVEYTEL